MSVQPLFVADVLPEATKRRNCRLLEQTGDMEESVQLAGDEPTYLVLVNENGDAIGLLSQEAWRNATDRQSLIQQTLTQPLLIVEQQMLLADVIRMAARMLFIHPEVVGVVVEEQGQFIGVLPTRTLEQHAREVETVRRLRESGMVSHTKRRRFCCETGCGYCKSPKDVDPDNLPHCARHPDKELKKV